MSFRRLHDQSKTTCFPRASCSHRNLGSKGSCFQLRLTCHVVGWRTLTEQRKRLRARAYPCLADDLMPDRMTHIVTCPLMKLSDNASVPISPEAGSSWGILGCSRGAPRGHRGTRAPCSSWRQPCCGRALHRTVWPPAAQPLPGAPVPLPSAQRHECLGALKVAGHPEGGRSG